MCGKEQHHKVISKEKEVEVKHMEGWKDMEGHRRTRRQGHNMDMNRHNVRRCVEGGEGKASPHLKIYKDIPQGHFCQVDMMESHIEEVCCGSMFDCGDLASPDRHHSIKV
jgi:hypothetical protein